MGFCEKFYFKPGDIGYPVFETAFCKVGVYICYDRHFPEGWRELAMNGAEVIFNPSATVRGLSDHLWTLEQPAAAVANCVYIGANNRVGSEPPWNNGHFYGSSYFVNPRGEILNQGPDDRGRAGHRRSRPRHDRRGARCGWNFYRDRRPDTYGRRRVLAGLSRRARGGPAMRKVKAALIQMNLKGDPASDSIETIRDNMIAAHMPLIAEAARQGVQVLGLQEVFNAPYFPATIDDRWFESAEAVPDGPTTQAMCQAAANSTAWSSSRRSTSATAAARSTTAPR